MTITKRRTHIKDEIYCEINFPQCPAFAGAERLCIGFRAPVAMHVARQLDEVVGVLRALEAASQRGHWCVGFIAHEAAAAFDAALVTQAVGDIPLVWFAEFSTGETLPAIDVTQGTFQLGRWQSDTSSDAFHTAVESIRADIANGRFYQVNFTTRLHAHFSGDALAFYRALEVAQPDGYHVYIDAGEFQLLSVSPELFFSMQAVGGQTTVIAQPMKGTAPRGDTAKLDAAIAEALIQSPKERAENLMIVDLLRNDLSRIAKSNSVDVPQLFSLHPLSSVWQMTSTVRATLQAGKTLTDIFAALFPCGSVTGAPKVEAVKAIGELEYTPRGAYCGAIGYVAPNNVSDGVAASTFNVGIRTVWIDGNRATCGVGGGITFDSTVSGEAAELAYKARFVQRASRPFVLFETIRLEEGEYILLDRHLARMENSARHFGFNFSIETALSKLKWMKSLYPSGVYRLRLTADSRGECHATAALLDAMPVNPLFQLAMGAVSRFDEFLQHKTTRRETYDLHAPMAGIWDTLLWNEQGELTEFIRANVVLDIDGMRVTPPLDCGLLNGTLREELMASRQIQERVLRRDDLARAEKIWWVNGLRGQVAVTEAIK